MFACVKTLHHGGFLISLLLVCVRPTLQPFLASKLATGGRLEVGDLIKRLYFLNVAFNAGSLSDSCYI